MKKLLLALLFIFAFAGSATSQTTEYTMSAGDTTFVAPFVNASAVYVTIRDSSISGQDTISAQLMYRYNGLVFLSTVSMHLLETTTTTTFIASNLLSPGDNTTKTYVFYPGNNAINCKYTGELFIRRLNTRTGEAVYAAKTRIIVTTAQ